MNQNKFFIFLVYLVLGLYLLNYPFSYIEIPAQIKTFEMWIIFAGGVFVILGGINYLRTEGKSEH